MGRLLDDLYKIGLSRIFLEIALSAARYFEISTTRIHLDGTSFHVDGEYQKLETESQRVSSSNEVANRLLTTDICYELEAKLPTEANEELVDQENLQFQSAEDFQKINITYGYSRDLSLTICFK